MDTSCTTKLSFNPNPNPVKLRIAKKRAAQNKNRVENSTNGAMLLMEWRYNDAGMMMIISEINIYYYKENVKLWMNNNAQSKIKTTTTTAMYDTI